MSFCRGTLRNVYNNQVQTLKSKKSKFPMELNFLVILSQSTLDMITFNNISCT